ncbi:MAG: hypothetical protein HYY24_00290 [Verrucomicrobia bacterium]|nr:hypothetical protein [Verrucomicrobiota bacterium]
MVKSLNREAGVPADARRGVKGKQIVRTLVFVSEAIENIAPGWRARETCKRASDDEFVETFELAAPGKEFEMFSESRLKRKQR